jgi:serine/threonine protein kinase HipA of HipAB toxin-antitoxin module
MKEGELHVLLAGLHVGRVLRLAPLYDLGSALPYPDINQRRLKLAMKLGSTYRVHDIGPRDFSKLAGELQLDEAQVLERARQLVRSFNEALPDICQRVRKASSTTWLKVWRLAPSRAHEFWRASP